jgi:hypothetical protein
VIVSRDKKSIYWIIENSITRSAYQIFPNVNDGTALNDAYGKGDVWFLSYNSAEIDDSAVRTNTSANLDAFVNGQSLKDADVVVWYGIHINHNHTGAPGVGETNISGALVAGPTSCLYAGRSVDGLKRVASR